MSSEEVLSKSLAAKVAINNNSSSNSEAEDDFVVTIDIDDHLLKCDRRLLIRHSKYFEALFAFQRVSPGNPSSDRVRIRGGIDYESASVIVKAIAGSDVLVNGENAQGILEASTFLQCQLAERAAADYILSNLSFPNAFSVFLLSLNCGSVYLAEKVEDYILRQLRNFDFRPKSVMEILTTSFDEINGCLERISSNDAAFGVICGWVLYDVRDRKQHLPGLLRPNVVAELVPPEAYEAVSELEDEPAIREALAESRAYEQLAFRGKVRHWDSPTAAAAAAMPSMRRWPRIAVVCSTGNNSPLVVFRSPRDSRWLKLTTKPFKLNVKSSGSVIAAVSGGSSNGQNQQSLLFIGGVGNVQMWSYNVKADSWKLLSAEQEERIRPLVCALGPEVFVFGGYSDARKEVTYLDTASKFDVVSGEWTMLSPMECSRSGGQACAMDGRIYLFGGLCSRRMVVVSCEVYDVAKDEFRPLTNLPRMIIDFGLVLVPSRSKVYVIGGMDPITFETKSSILVFDLLSGEWSFDFPSLNVARKSCGCFFDGDSLYAVAGSTAELEQLSSVERFNASLNRWEVIDCLPKGLAASTGSAVVDLPVRLMANYRDLGQSTMAS